MSLGTDPYKGTRDFYPDDMAVERYIFDTWAKSAELFGFERYDASVLEPAELYRSKAAENEEIINDQTYTFTDRGDREVTLRPEMTPTVARMIAGRRRELSFPVRWYSIPNVFRYERPQRGRLREHWQLNCDIFGATDASSDIEIIALGHHILTSFGADPNMFEVRVNDRAWLNREFDVQNIPHELRNSLLALLDRKEKIDNFDEEAEKLLGRPYSVPTEIEKGSRLDDVVKGLRSLGIENVRFSPSTVRGFNYYTGVVFEIFDISGENNRSLIGGGRYDNLTELFGGEPIPGIGFGMGDVTMRDFLMTHNLLPENITKTAPTLIIISTNEEHNSTCQNIAQTFRSFNIKTSVDTSNRKIGKKIGTASDRGATYVVVVGSNEIQTNHYTLKNLQTEEERMGTPSELASQA
jgi:histidyl-tRNA synthetase